MLSLTRQCLWKGRSLSNNHGSGRGGSKGRSFSRTFLSFYWREALCSLFCSFAGSGVWAKGLVWIPRSTTLCSPKGCSEANIVWCFGFHVNLRRCTARLDSQFCDSVKPPRWFPLPNHYQGLNGKSMYPVLPWCAVETFWDVRLG